MTPSPTSTPTPRQLQSSSAMRLFPFLRYLARKIRYPEFTDFLDQGEGIQARHFRAGGDWADHLNQSKEFQQKVYNLNQTSRRSLAVLGAGRLLDFNQESSLQHFNSISLFDADPGCLPVWKKFQRQAKKHQVEVAYQLLDLTGCLQRWTVQLKQLLLSNTKPSHSSLTSFLDTLAQQDKPIAIQGVFDTTLSLNLLSQISLFFRDRAHQLVSQYGQHLLDNDGEFPSETNQYFERVYTALQTQHLSLLQQMGSNHILVITDTDYRYYRTPDNSLQVEPALFVPSPLTLPGYTLEQQANWFWHIVPEGLENGDYGIIHPIAANYFKKICRKQSNEEHGKS